MKKLIYVVVSILMFSSCSKSDDVSPGNNNNLIVGLWKLESNTNQKKYVLFSADGFCQRSDNKSEIGDSNNIKYEVRGDTLVYNSGAMFSDYFIIKKLSKSEMHIQSWGRDEFNGDIHEYKKEL